MRLKAICTIDDNGVRVLKCLDREQCGSWARSGYLKRPNYLDALEAAYQASSNAIIVDGDTGWRKAMEILYRFSESLAMFIVYLDLRSRGRRVIRGVRKDTLIVKMGKESFEILVLEEGSEVELEWLAEWSRIASGDGFNPIVAIVDRNGDVTYYELRASLELN